MSTLTVNEKSTLVLTITATDETGAAVTPDTAVWSLYDQNEAIVNSRSAVAIVPASSMTVVLSDDDFDMADGKGRTFVIETTYTSANGAGLTQNEEQEIFVIDLAGAL